jgi:hypothetical protein
MGARGGSSPDGRPLLCHGDGNGWTAGWLSTSASRTAQGAAIIDECTSARRTDVNAACDGERNPSSPRPSIGAIDDEWIRRGAERRKRPGRRQSSSATITRTERLQQERGARSDLATGVTHMGCTDPRTVNPRDATRLLGAARYRDSNLGRSPTPGGGLETQTVGCFDLSAPETRYPSPSPASTIAS